MAETLRVAGYGEGNVHVTVTRHEGEAWFQIHRAHERKPNGPPHSHAGSWLTAAHASRLLENWNLAKKLKAKQEESRQDPRRFARMVEPKTGTPRLLQMTIDEAGKVVSVSEYSPKEHEISTTPIDEEAAKALKLALKNHRTNLGMQETREKR